MVTRNLKPYYVKDRIYTGEEVKKINKFIAGTLDPKKARTFYNRLPSKVLKHLAGAGLKSKLSSVRKGFKLTGVTEKELAVAFGELVKSGFIKYSLRRDPKKTSRKLLERVREEIKRNGLKPLKPDKKLKPVKGPRKSVWEMFKERTERFRYPTVLKPKEVQEGPAPKDEEVSTSSVFSSGLASRRPEREQKGEAGGLTPEAILAAPKYQQAEKEGSLQKIQADSIDDSSLKDLSEQAVDPYGEDADE